MYIILTGATGYLGSHILRLLLDCDYKILIIKRSFSDTTRIKYMLDNNNVRCYDIDHNDWGELFSMIQSVSMIIHAATNYRNGSALTILHDNVLFPLELLDQAILFGNNPVFINIDSYFSKNENIGNKYLESYTLSKRSILEWLKTYMSQVHIINFRLEHVFGAGDSNKKFINSIVEKLIRNETHIDLTFGEQKRDFIYIDDVVIALLYVIKSIDYNKSGFAHYDIGRGQTLSIKHFVKQAKKISGASSTLNFGSIPYREHEIFFSKADRSNIDKIGWKPSVSIEDGIKKVINSTLLCKNNEIPPVSG